MQGNQIIRVFTAFLRAVMTGKYRANMKTTTNKSFARKKQPPFIGLERPFVGRCIPRTLPFIGGNIPFVTFRPKVAGFTLIELMITLVIVGILVAFGAPRMYEFLLNNRMVGATNEFVVEFLYARGEAIKRSSTVTFCKRDATQPSPTCSTTGADWSAGWYTFTDRDGDGVIGPLDEVLRETINPSVTVSAGTRIADAISFTRYGLATFRPNIFGTDPDDRQFKLSDSRGCSANLGRTIELTTTGHAKTIMGC
jgi:type IV fimbrial biogenesis protein FimT